MIVIQKSWTLEPIVSYCPLQDTCDVLSVENTRENREAICLVIQYWNSVKTYSPSTNLINLYVDILKSCSFGSDFPSEPLAFQDLLNSISNNSQQISILGIIFSWKTSEELEEFEEKEGGKNENSVLTRRAFHRALQMKGQKTTNPKFLDPTIVPFAPQSPISFRVIELQIN